MNKKLTAATLSIAMAVTMAPTMMQTASVNAASAAVQSLAGGAIAMAYVSTALNKMDNSAEGQQESLARTKEKTGYLKDSAAQERVNRIMKTLEATPSVKRSYVVYANPDEEFNAFATLGRVMSINKGALDTLMMINWPMSWLMKSLMGSIKILLMVLRSKSVFLQRLALLLAVVKVRLFYLMWQATTYPIKCLR